MGNFEIVDKKTNDSWSRDYVCPNCDKRLSIDNIMSVFDDFMRGDVNENDKEIFKNMLLDKVESEKE